jgi:hypothetical protein
VYTVQVYAGLIHPGWPYLFPKFADVCSSLTERARNHQPLHGVMIVLKEVERDPIGADAPMSRAVIDQTMALCGPDGGVTGMQDDEVMSRPLKEGGQEAWDLITRLRSRAWIVSCFFP